MRGLSLRVGLGLAAVLAGGASAAPPVVRLNTVGYLPDARKAASIDAQCSRFTVVRVGDGSTALAGTVDRVVNTPENRRRVWVADFSRLCEPGEYQLDVPRVGRSAPFRVAEDVYDGPFGVAMRAMYLWRCGTAVKAEHRGRVFAHAACHTDDAWLDLVSGGHARKDASGGWHDAGDYNKYVVNAGVTVGVLLRAWDDFGPRLRDVRLGIPESGGKTPDVLAEVRWELEWLLRTQAPDGSTYQKVSTKDFGGMVLPEGETAPRYLAPWGSAATADLVAMTACASRHFRPTDLEFARRCLKAARDGYAFLRAHPRDHPGDLSGFHTGGYQTPDPDDRLWAAAELWEATGDPDALRDLESRVRSVQSRVARDLDWGDVQDLGLLTYLFSTRNGRDAGLVRDVRKSLLATADAIVEAAAQHADARPLGSRYYWGCNGAVARLTVLLQAAHRVDPRPAYRAAALDALNYLLGRNPFGRSFVTGLGDRPPLHPHDRRSAGDSVAEPWPGYLVGGPHPTATDWADEQDDYRTNEIAINWNSALIYALAGFHSEKAR
jgi:endoglucanase